MTAPVVVCGFLGAGKTTLCAGLKAHGITAQELDGLMAPAALLAGAEARVITVVDCANLASQLEDAGVAPLLNRQIATAGLIVLSRSALASPEDACARLSALTDAPIVDAPPGALDAAALDQLPASLIPAQTPADDLSGAFELWEYLGAARLGHALAERLAEARPKGLTRLSGEIRTDKGGLEIEITGRVRQTRNIALPADTRLTARGPRGVLGRTALDNWFAEAVSDSGHGFGMFGYR